MQRNDWIVAAAAAVLAAVGALTAFTSASTTSEFLFRASILALLAIMVGLQVWFFRKLQGQAVDQQRYLVTLLDSLHQPLRELHPRFPLPSMRVPGNWTATPDFAQILMGLIEQERPRVVVELGSGVSSVVCGYTVEKNGEGRVVSLDHERAYAEKSQELVASHDLQACVNVRHAALREYSLSGETWRWYDEAALHDVQLIDLLIVDGPPAAGRPWARYPALPLLMKKLSDRAVIVLDDGVRKDEREIVRRWLKEFAGFRSEYLQTEKGTFILRRIV